jgi:transcriptional regulator with XRE-family HTH domain
MWRQRVRPEHVGLPAGPRRRAVGLRREELAGLAAISTDYPIRLEQGRAQSPSPEVIAALARALQLTETEHDHLLRLAGHEPPGPRSMRRHTTPALHRILDRLRDLPVFVFDRAWTLQSANPLATALIGDIASATGLARNIVWRHFTGAGERIVRNNAETRAYEHELVADLHEAAARYPDDRELARLLSALRAESSRFVELWQQRPAARISSQRKTVDHPEVGPIELDCDVLRADGTDLLLIVYSAVPGSHDEQLLELLAVVGLQRFEAPAP